MKHILTLLSLIFINVSFSQNFKFGKVSKEELLEKKHPIDSTACASYLYKNRKTSVEYNDDDGFYLNTDIHERIKLYNKEGYKYATKIVNLYISGSKKEKISKVKAITYNLNSGKIDETKLKNEGVFENEVSELLNQTKFTMPNIEVGSVIEFQYTVKSPFINNINEFQMQKDIPIKKLEAVFESPEYLMYKTNFKGYLPAKPTKESKRGSFIYKSKSMPKSGGVIEEYEDEYEYTINVDKYDFNNVEALKNEPFVGNIDNYRSGVIYELSYTKFPNTSMEYFSTTWEDIVKTIYESEDFGGQLQKTNYFEKDIDALIQGATDPMEIAALIFDFIKTKVRWNNFGGYYTSNSVKKAYKEGEGNVADINLMLIAMLRYAGLNASPILISTRSNGIPIVATKSGFNYVIAAIEVPDGLIMLDATDLNAAPNIIPKHALNWQGRIVREHGSSTWVNLTPNDVSKEIISLNVQLNPDLSVDGKVRKLFSNYLAYNFRDNYKGISTDSHIALLEKDKEGIEISNLEVSNQNDLIKPVIYSYDYHLVNELEDIGDKIYFTPMLFLAPKENFFKQDSRQYPIDFIYPLSEKYTINIMLPEGYVVESIPESAKIEFNSTEGEFSYLAKENGAMLQFIITLDLNKSLILPNEYAQFKKFFEFVIEKQTEKVVLKKG